MIEHILKVDASMRVSDSNSRKLANKLITTISNKTAQLTHRDLSKGLPFINEDWISANFTAADERNAQQQEILSMSELLIEELEVADTIVIAIPIYNFGVPAAFKAWIDMITRARRTFQYTESGPEGLLTGKKAYIVITSGGTKLGSDIDFVSAWVKHILAFIGITDSKIIDASGLMVNEQEVLSIAEHEIAQLTTG
ncbi:FMN-dependent NADH-azoreductase [Colwelliaceae bacterium 6441]